MATSDIGTQQVQNKIYSLLLSCSLQLFLILLLNYFSFHL
uniref:Uncharacterized protein n=1 Tax=Arundo donax TaxID=35708 RepID=A0A0A9C4F2_ARUDO